jgi:hypothetical protein
MTYGTLWEGRTLDWPRLAPDVPRKLPRLRFERVRLGGHYATPLVHKVGVKQLIVAWTCEKELRKLIVAWTCEKELRKLIVVWTYEYVHENMCVYLCVYVRVDYDRVSGARYTHMYVDGPVGLAVSGPSGLTSVVYRVHT